MNEKIIIKNKKKELIEKKFNPLVKEFRNDFLETVNVSKIEKKHSKKITYSLEEKKLTILSDYKKYEINDVKIYRFQNYELDFLRILSYFSEDKKRLFLFFVILKGFDLKIEGDFIILRKFSINIWINIHNFKILVLSETYFKIEEIKRKLKVNKGNFIFEKSFADNHNYSFYYSKNSFFLENFKTKKILKEIKKEDEEYKIYKEFFNNKKHFKKIDFKKFDGTTLFIQFANLFLFFLTKENKILLFEITKENYLLKRELKFNFDEINSKNFYTISINKVTKNKLEFFYEDFFYICDLENEKNLEKLTVTNISTKIKKGNNNLAVIDKYIKFIKKINIFSDFEVEIIITGFEPNYVFNSKNKFFRIKNGDNFKIRIKGIYKDIKDFDVIIFKEKIYLIKNNDEKINNLSDKKTFKFLINNLDYLEKEHKKNLLMLNL